jgi:hypothetical protein
MALLGFVDKRAHEPLDVWITRANGTSKRDRPSLILVS